ncbi:hypothetical protein QYF68_31875 [Mycolicibacterium austroafricanum]|uniref:Uncharacterized protein n=1 Tax=Mycolicibacterium austroafricanum TaxID=39687 RepID=A0ABT8HNP6_MYCAO|nr:hypothetical protein [Mycolicibacterium austroafricanum]MDN4522386.1 hypothetical protein [Mycolicibacterium austroafricanum]
MHWTATVVLDLAAAACSVVLALWWTSGPIFERHIAMWVWEFVPVLVLVLASRRLHRRRFSAHFLDELERVLTSVSVSALLTLALGVLEVPRLAAGEAPGDYVRPGEVGVKLWVCARLVRSLTQR